jgi:Na+/H+ antiporter NhaD/arsenite permease-like protein
VTNLMLVLIIFVLAYLAIVTERIHKTIVSLVGAALMISLGCFRRKRHSIRMNTVWTTT